MVPSPGMDLQLEPFLMRNNCTQCAFVIPTYEISLNSSHLPQTKTELVEFVKVGEARQFHEEIWPLNQNLSDLQRWEKIPETDELDEAYKVKKYKFPYEPIYVSRGNTPAFDERFIGFGFDRNSQVRPREIT